MEHSEDAAINDWGRTLRRWQEYILNYFDHYTTNAYTEGVHTKMKLMKRMSYGFKNVDIYIKKMLLSFVPITLIPLINFYHTF
jgi:transposase